MLSITTKGLYYHLVHQAEIRATLLNMHIGQHIQHLVVIIGGELFHGRNTLGCFADGLHHLIAFLPLFQQDRYQLWWMLHITIHSNNSISISMIQTTGKSQLMTGVSGQKNRLYSFILLFQRTKNFPASILGAIIYKH